MDAVENRQSQLVRRGIVRLGEGVSEVCQDTLTVEEPLEIRIGTQAIAVIMRTPRDDFDLAAGFLFTEGLIDSCRDLAQISYCSNATPPNLENVIEVRLTQGVEFDSAQLKRNFYASSSCGVCGKASIEAITQRISAMTVDFQVELEVLYSLDHKLRAAQTVFAQTGSLHAAGLFDECGDLLVLREDVGRHNAVDKVVGSFLLRNKPIPPRSILLVSGRASFEIIQKAHSAGIPIVAAVSAPSSLAVDLASEGGMTLLGFLRGSRCNIYTGEQRIAT